MDGCDLGYRVLGSSTHPEMKADSVMYNWYMVVHATVVWD
jgi:hypothetical protein